MATDVPHGMFLGGRRSEDRNARQAFRDFNDGATLTELEEFVAAMRRRGAPDDAHPEVTLNDHHEIVGIVCVTERFPSGS
jgi:hypothetical protein